MTRTELEKIPAYIVFYRGNGYGLFLNKKIAEEFGEFIAPRNEKKYNTHEYGKYKATIRKTNMLEGLETRKEI